MAEFIDTLFGSGAVDFWPRTVPMLVLIAAIPIIARFIKTPTRPDPDPLADVEFDENGAVKKRDE